MKQAPVKLGPLALLLAVISICLAILAILTFSTARADLRLAEKYAQTASLRCSLEAKAQELLSDYGANGPSGAPAEWERDPEGVYWRTLEQDGFRLRIGLRDLGSDYEIVAWMQEREWTQNEHIENLWTGS